MLQLEALRGHGLLLTLLPLVDVSKCKKVLVFGSKVPDAVLKKLYSGVCMSVLRSEPCLRTAALYGLKLQVVYR